MEALALIEVIIGLVFVVLLLSVIVSLVNEIIVTNFKVRSRSLKKSISRLLDDSNSEEILSEDFYNHPLINKLNKSKKSNPSYISSSTFSKVLVDILKSKNLDTNSLKESMNSLPENSETKKALLTLLDDADNDTQKFKLNIEEWFNESMQRLSGRFKRNIQVQLFIIGFIAAVILNVNIIYIAKEISDDKEKRMQLVDAAYSIAKDNKEKLTLEYDNLNKLYKTSKEAFSSKGMAKNDSTELYNPMQIDSISSALKKKDSAITHQLENYEADIDSINNSTNENSGLVGIFWQDYIDYTHPESEEEGFFHRFGEKFELSWIVGWLIAALGASLGSAFWFDILKKLINIRGTVKPENTK
jgi:hypothetical protein